MSPVPFRGVVLAGGRSSRMGVDKATLIVDGQAMVLRVRDALVAAGADRVDVVGGSGDRLAALGLDPVPDVIPDGGPLAGIVTGLALGGTDLVVVLACDLLAPAAEAIGALARDLADRPGAAAAVPEVAGKPQWLHGAWRASVAEPPLRAALEAGERAVWRAVQGLAVTATADVDAELLRDADRPSDLSDRTTTSPSPVTRTTVGTQVAPPENGTKE